MSEKRDRKPPIHYSAVIRDAARDRWVALRNGDAVERETGIEGRTIRRWAKRPDWIAAAEAYDAALGAAARDDGQRLFRELAKRFHLADGYYIRDEKDAIALFGKAGALVPKPAQVVEAAVDVSGDGARGFEALAALMLDKDG